MASVAPGDRARWLGAAGTPSAFDRPAPHLAAADRLRVLLVEDDAVDAATVRHALGGSPGGEFSVHAVSRLADAEEHLQSEAVDCILLDLQLPDAEGLEGLLRLAAVVPDVPVVVLTELADEALAMRALQHGAQDYLSKSDADGAPLRRTILYAIERRHTELVYRHLATHDALTGLANRQMLTDRLQFALTRLSREPGLVALIFLDLDGFKWINDSLGHEAGDVLLAAFADRLQDQVRSPDLVGRLGGDEFLILLDRVPSEFAALALADRIQLCLAAPFSDAGSDVWLNASMGIALTHDSDLGPGALIQRADQAMYQAKEAGRSRSVLYDDDMVAYIKDRLAMKNDIKHGLDDGEFLLHFQPIVDLSTRERVGHEALVRWQRADGRLLLPGSFMEVAEQSGLILPLGHRILELACARLAQDASDGAEVPALLSVNVSPRQLASPTFAASVARTIGDTGVDPTRLAFEVTETAVVIDETASLNRLKQLKSLGARLFMDDFGTGFSSLTYLHRYPFDAIKIDMSFVQGLTRVGDPSAAIVSALVQLGRSLDLMVIAEGVETEAQAECLLSLGCTLAQGFLLGRPAAEPAPAAPAATSPR